MRKEMGTAVTAMIVLTILLGLVYPLLIDGIGQVVFPGNANGQQVYINGKLVGSKIIGQSFKTPVLEKNGKPKVQDEEVVTEAVKRYFQSRPSATEGGAYNAAASAFSNRGPNSKITAEDNAEAVNEYLELNRPYDPTLTAGQIPVDAVSTSGSNLDPEISSANARIQAHRVAALRDLSLATVDRLVWQHTSSRGLGFSGQPGVNVLELNLALDRLAKGAS